MKDKLVTVKNYESMIDAMFELEILRDNQIECNISNENSVELLPMFNEINEGLKIVVLEKDYKEAIQILEEYNNNRENIK